GFLALGSILPMLDRSKIKVEDKKGNEILLASNGKGWRVNENTTLGDEKEDSSASLRKSIGGGLSQASIPNEGYDYPIVSADGKRALRIIDEKHKHVSPGKYRTWKQRFWDRVFGETDKYKTKTTEVDRRHVVVGDWGGPVFKNVIVKPDAQDCPYLTNTLHEPYHGGILDLQFTPDGKHHGYAAYNEGKYSIVIDGIKTELPDVKYDRVGYFVLSPDGKRYSLWAEKGWREYDLIIDGKVDRTVSYPPGIMFSPDSEHVAYVVDKAFDTHGNKKAVVLDGSRGEWHKGISRMRFNNKSELVYAAMDTKRVPTGKGYDDDVDEYVFVKNTKNTKAASEAGEIKDIVFSDNDAHMAYFDNKRVFIDGKPEPKFWSPQEMVFNPDGTRLAYRVYLEPGKQAVILDSAQGPVFTDIEHMFFSRDAEHLVYVGKYKWDGNGEKDTKEYIVLDNDIELEFDIINNAAFNDRGILEISAVIDGIEQKWFISPLSKDELTAVLKDRNTQLNKVPKKGKNPSIRKKNVNFSLKTLAEVLKKTGGILPIMLAGIGLVSVFFEPTASIAYVPLILGGFTFSSSRKSRAPPRKKSGKLSIFADYDDIPPFIKDKILQEASPELKSALKNIDYFKSMKDNIYLLVWGYVGYSRVAHFGRKVLADIIDGAKHKGVNHHDKFISYYSIKALKPFLGEDAVERAVFDILKNLDSTDIGSNEYHTRAQALVEVLEPLLAKEEFRTLFIEKLNDHPNLRLVAKDYIAQHAKDRDVFNVIVNVLRSARRAQYSEEDEENFLFNGLGDLARMLSILKHADPDNARLRRELLKSLDHLMSTKPINAEARKKPFLSALLDVIEALTGHISKDKQVYDLISGIARKHDDERGRIALGAMLDGLPEERLEPWMKARALELLKESGDQVMENGYRYYLRNPETREIILKKLDPRKNWAPSALAVFAGLSSGLEYVLKKAALFTGDILTSENGFWENLSNKMDLALEKHKNRFVAIPYVLFYVGVYSVLGLIYGMFKLSIFLIDQTASYLFIEEFDESERYAILHAIAPWVKEDQELISLIADKVLDRSEWRRQYDMRIFLNAIKESAVEDANLRKMILPLTRSANSNIRLDALLFFGDISERIRLTRAEYEYFNGLFTDYVNERGDLEPRLWMVPSYPNDLSLLTTIIGSQSARIIDKHSAQMKDLIMETLKSGERRLGSVPKKEKIGKRKGFVKFTQFAIITGAALLLFDYMWDVVEPASVMASGIFPIGIALGTLKKKVFSQSQLNPASRGNDDEMMRSGDDGIKKGKTLSPSPQPSSLKGEGVNVGNFELFASLAMVLSVPLVIGLAAFHYMPSIMDAYYTLIEGLKNLVSDPLLYMGAMTLPVFGMMKRSSGVDGLTGLKEGQVVAGFKAKALYLNADGKPMGARFIHPSGMPVDVMFYASIPKASLNFKTIPVSNKGESHALEHLVLGKGLKGKYFNSLLDMRMGDHTAGTHADITNYQISAALGKEEFYDLLEVYIGSLINPDFTDEEIMREVANLGVYEDDNGVLHLEEKGSVYTEMVSSMEKDGSVNWNQLRKMMFGEDHPFGLNSGGDPSAMWGYSPQDIRRFHDENYHLGPNMEMITAIPTGWSLEEFLGKLSGMFERIDPNSMERDYKTIPKYDPVQDSEIRIGRFPSDNMELPQNVSFVWKPIEGISQKDFIRANMLLQLLGEGEKSYLHKDIVDQSSRKIDSGATGVDAGVYDMPMAAPVVELSGLPVSSVNPEMLGSLRSMMIDRIKWIAQLKDNSDELAQVAKKARSLIESKKRDMLKFIDTPPPFGQRSSGARWHRHLDHLNKNSGFKRSLDLNDIYEGLLAEIDSGKNPWASIAQEFNIFESPFVSAVKPDSGLGEKQSQAKDARMKEHEKALLKKYATSDLQEALKKFKSDIDKKTLELEERERSIPKPAFLVNPPLTFDDIEYVEEPLLDGVKLVRSFFGSTSFTDMNMNFDVTGVSRDDHELLPILPAVVSELGVVKRNGDTLDYSQAKEQMSAEISKLEAGYAGNAQTGRFELGVSAIASRKGEISKAVEWLEDHIQRSRITDKTRERLIDISKKKIKELRTTFQLREEKWIGAMGRAYSNQDKPILMAVNSKFTALRHLNRLRWRLEEMSEQEYREV
ncbi:hypothetical protein ACFL6Y_11025, partial [Elusimicrobiota bacterium]